MIQAFFLTWLGILVAQMSPGPNRLALGDGRRPALFVVSGVAAGILIWSLQTSLGPGALLIAYPLSVIAMKLVGGSYPMFFSLKALRGMVDSVPMRLGSETRQFGQGGAQGRGLVVLLTNPKAALMWATVATFLFGQGLSPAQVLAFGPVGALSGLAVYGTYALLLSTDLAARGYASFAGWLESIFAAGFGSVGEARI